MMARVRYSFQYIILIFDLNLPYSIFERVNFQAYDALLMIGFEHFDVLLIEI